uniref:Uncharacterized protein n=1 Tax=Anguilla anguilla TaxID=7936 RepID=A0A0E9QU30_ANGAN
MACFLLHISQCYGLISLLRVVKRWKYYQSSLTLS